MAAWMEEKSPFVGAVGIMLPTVFKVAGDANNGVVSADIYFWNLPPFTTIPENVSFVAAFKKAYGVEPDKSAALGAAALQVWARAVGIAVAALSALSNFLFIPYYPIWALVLIALDVAVIWALATYSPKD